MSILIYLDSIILYLIYAVLSNTKITAKLTNVIRSSIVKKEIINRVSFEELVVATGGYGVSSIEICKDSPILNKRLIESELRQHGITVLTIERDGEVIPNPTADSRILMRDKLVCFGKLSDIRKWICFVPE